MAKLYGDVPKEHRELLIEVEKEVIFWDAQLGKVPVQIISRAYVCLAHDFYEMGLEEEGQRLLIRAENICPGFFKDEVPRLCEEDPRFEYLVARLTGILAFTFADLIERHRGG